MTQIPVVSRTFHLVLPTGSVEAVLTIFRPTDEGGGEYRCRYELLAPNERASSAIAGVDELQALVLSLRTALVELELLAKRLGGSVEDYQLDDLRLR